MCVQVYCGGPTGDFGFMPHLARFLPLEGPISILDAGANLGGASILFAQARICRALCPAGFAPVFSALTRPVVHPIASRACRSVLVRCSTLLQSNHSSSCTSATGTVLTARGGVQLIAFNGEVLGVDANPMTYELLQDNIHNWSDTITTVKSAIVAHDVAQSGATMNFTGDSNQYWGFRVEHKGSENKKATRVVHTVPTTSLPMLKVRHLHAFLSCVHSEPARQCSGAALLSSCIRFLC